MDDPHEAELLADMWNRSDAGWPGGWTGGITWTAERVLREFMAHNCYACWVAEHKGEIVGYISLEADASQPQRATVGLLNARPDHHGKGVGRRLLREAVRRTVEDGFEQVDIYTWPANLKAVPLYKKAGFFWSPETSVHMQNFIPTILHMPILADFFKGRNWYRVQERDLSVCEDVEHWHGVRVYRYCFAADGRRVEVLVDRQACTPSAIETDEVAVAAWVGVEDLPALQEHVVHYELRNKTGRPMSVSLLARGEDGVPLSAAESFELTKLKRLSLPFRLPADLERKRPGEPPHRIFTTLTVDGVPISLGTAIAMRDPVEIEYAGQGLLACKWTEMLIKLRNRLPFPVEGKLWVGLPPAFESDRQKLDFRIPRAGWAHVSLRVRAPAAGASPVDLRVDFGEETARRLTRGKTAALPARGRRRTVWLRAFAPGVFVASEDAEKREITVETDRCRLVFRRVHGWTTLHDKTLGRNMMRLDMPEAGPPFGDFLPIPRIHEADFDREGACIRLTTRQRLDRYPGLALERTLVLTAGLLRVELRLVNSSAEPAEVKVRAGYHGHVGPGRFTLPDAGGLLQRQRDSYNDWPGYNEIVLPAREFPESWVAEDREGGVAGIVWEGEPEVSPRGGPAVTLTYGPVRVPPGGSIQLPCAYLVAGPGDWKVVRSAWATHVHPGRLVTPEDKEPATRDVLKGGLSEMPALLSGASRRTAVEIVTEQQRVINGDAHLRLPSVAALGNGKRELHLPVRDVRRGKPFRKTVTLKPRSDRPSAGEGELELVGPRESRRFPVPVVILRTGRRQLELEHDEDTVSVDTGWTSFRASAAHGGSVVSLRRRGTRAPAQFVPHAHPVLVG